MILKELDPYSGQPQAVMAARIAADRMAYALRRLFRNSATVDVLNGLRLPVGRSMALIDHLVLHDDGIIVLGHVQAQGSLYVDGDGQWSRRGSDDAAVEPIASPLTHAYIQALLLKDYLDRHVHQKGVFDVLTLEALVVVPDDARMEWPASGTLDDVCTRDEAEARIQACMARARRPGAGPGPLNAGERKTIGRFLCQAHHPEQAPQASSSPAPL